MDTSIDILTAAVILVALQLLAGRGAFGLAALALRAQARQRGGARRGRRFLLAADAFACMRGTTLVALAVLGLDTLVQLFGWGPTTRELEPVPLAFPGLSIVIGGPATASLYVVLRAGHDESRGRLSRARRRVRVGGQTMFLGTVGWIVVFGAALFTAPGAVRGQLIQGTTMTLQIVGAVVGLGTAGFLGLLAGLSGKPRPTGTIAALVYLFGVLAMVAAAQPSPGPAC